MTKRNYKAVPIIVSLIAIVFITPNPTVAQSGGRFYNQTGHTLAAQFVAFFDQHGGLAQFGYPLNEVTNENGILTQYTERASLEYHPENQPPYDVQLGLLGVALTAGRDFPPAGDTLTGGNDVLYFDSTHHTLRGPFRTYWEQHGGLALFGYPISEPFSEGGVQVQYFERNRFEYHPELPNPYKVSLGLLGRDLLVERVTIGEESVTLPTYQYQGALYNQPGDSIAPYQRLDFSKVGPPQPQAYRLITLENRYLKLSVMPQLGGRLYGVLFKPSGHQEVYQNPVIKPSRFGVRGWWLGVGGAEWAFPTQEHGYLEASPWDYRIVQHAGSGSVIVSTTERSTGVQMAVTISLRPEEASYHLSVQLTNPTSQPATYQAWTNTMLAPGGSNHVPLNTSFDLPIDEAVLHSSADTALPQPHGVFSWPLYNGRDLSLYRNWSDYLGFFATTTTQDWAAVYNADAQEGMVKSFDHQQAPGLKLFGYGPKFDLHAYTDDNSDYVELWGGLQPSFWDNNSLAPAASIGWDETWYPILGIGAPRNASASAALDVVMLDSNRLRISAAPSRPVVGGQIQVVRGGQVVFNHTADASPDKPLIIEPPAGPDTYTVQYLAPDGQALAVYTASFQ